MNVTHKTPAPSIDNVEVALYDADELNELHPEWDDLSNEEKLALLRDEEVEPEDQFEQHNVTTNDYHDHLRDLANPRTSTDVEEAEYIAFGSDIGHNPGDSSLNSENNRFRVTSHETDDQELQTITLLSSDQAVGDSLLEAGLVSESSGGMFFNLVELDDPEDRLDPKTQDYAVTVTIIIQYADESEV